MTYSLRCISPGYPQNDGGPAGLTSPPLQVSETCSDRAYVHGLGALVSALRLVLDAGTLGERAVALGFDAAVVDEEILAAFIGSDEAEALLVAEPLDSACCHVFLHGVFVLRLPW